MIEDRRGGPPHAAVLAAVVLVVMLLPTLIGDQCDALLSTVAELLNPLGLLLLPITLILAIHFLSSAAGSSVAGIFSTANPSYIHTAGGGAGSTTGIVVFLLLLLMLLCTRVSIFSGSNDDD
ncbi:uncharacterized protein LOC125206825 [Salvia hispanica]|uniref:uncharacterized protein LOC125206825 n=1 Tax=Salvia hispanica TaxID=49212 RepID=UPI0020090C9D|nr:uncharacterized protein LOC125206825 [Salvia hispanica]